MPVLAKIAAPVATSCMVSMDGQELPLRAAEVRATASAGLAVVTLVQTFVNAGMVPLEVRYQLPLPANSAVGGFVITVADRRIVGEVQRREQARATYQRAVFEGRTAALLEQEREGLFTQSVGNVPPGAEVTVEVTVDQPLVWESDGWTWRFPTVVAPRYVDGATPDAGKLAVRVADRPLPARLSLSLAVADALTGAVTSSSHVLEVQGGQVSLGAGQVRLDRDVVVHWPVAQAAPGVVAQWGRCQGQTFGALVLVPPTVAAAAVRRDLVVLLDVSGSMGGRPLEQAVRVVSRLVTSLGDRDTLELIAFGGSVWSWRPAAVACTAAARAEAVAWLEGLRASGGTPMDEGIARALRGERGDAQRQILLVTDGHIGFEQRIVGLIAAGLGAASRLHTLGVGSSVNQTLLRGAARAGRGIEATVAPDQDVGPTIARVLRATDRPQVVDLQVIGEAEVSPRRLPDLFAGEPARLAVRAGAGPLRLVGRTAAGPWSCELGVPDVADERPALARLWAREAVEDLVTDGVLGADVGEAIERLGVTWAIATSRTSWVAVSPEVQVDSALPTRSVLVPHELPQHYPAAAMFGAPPPSPSLAAPTGGAVRLRAMPRAAAPRPAAPPPQSFADEEIDAMRAPAEPEPAKPAKRSEGLFERARRWAFGGKLALRFVRKDVITELVVVLLEVVAAGDWSLPASVEARLADGSVRRYAVQVARSTGSASVAAGDQLRLVLVGAAADAGQWVGLTVGASTVEL